MNRCAGEHRIILDLGSAKRRAVRGNDDKLGFGLAQVFQDRLVSKRGFTALHNQGKFGVDGFNGFLLRLLVIRHLSLLLTGVKFFLPEYMLKSIFI